MDLRREAERWQALGIIDAEQRRRIVELYAAQGPSLAVLAIFWVGGALLFLGVAFLLAIVWNDLGPLRVPLVLALDGAFFAAGAGLRRARPELERTAMALLVIGGLLLPPALGIAYEDVFGSSGHPMPLVLLCAAIYAALMVWLRSHAFACLLVWSTFVAGEEVIRDQDAFGAAFPLVQLGVVGSLEDVWPLVFYSLAALTLAGSWLSGRTVLAPLRSTLWVSGLLLGLLPGLVGMLATPYAYRGLNQALGVVACLAAIGASVAARERKGFWVSGAALVVALLVLFGEVFEDSIAFTCFAIVLGAGILVVATVLATRKDTWLDRLFPPQVEGAAGDNPDRTT
jgi:hypothetical protein